MKLNYKRTILVGFAFFLISAFWQAYDAIVPLILTNHFGLEQGVSGIIMSFDNILAVFMLPVFGAISDKINTRYGRRTPFVFFGTVAAVIAFTFLTVVDNMQLDALASGAPSGGLLIGFIAVLLVVLISMATFRSPAVALMPDVTVKPLRSKGNAIINLMGAAGGILVLALGIVFGTGKQENQMMSLTGYVLAVVGIMVFGLLVFLFTVKEKKWAEEMEADTVRYGLTETAEADTGEKRNLSRPEFISLLLILASVALWYIGYNSITSKYSVYATDILGFDFNSTLIIAQAAAIVSYIPVGIVASKIGRKKSILAGVAMLATAFFAGHFITPDMPAPIMFPIFVLAGIGWATINVNSFPMVVELARGGDVGKYTGFYYTASMAAQIVAPILSGFLYDALGMRNVFFVFGTVFVALSFVTMFFVRHGDAKPEARVGLEALDTDD